MMSGMNIPRRIAADIRDRIAHGVLQPGDPVESTRALAARLGCSRGTVVTAYDQLIAEGYLVAETGSGTRINPDLATLHPASSSSTRAATASAPPEKMTRLTPGAPDTTGLITPAWRAAWREAAAVPQEPTPAAGSEDLRAEIASHLRHMRGVMVDPARIVVTAGAREGLGMLLQALGQGLRIGVESPGYPSLRKVPRTLGHTLVEVPVDASGMTEPTKQLDAVIVTPSHQYPSGGSMHAKRRTQLVQWARREGALIIEDDFDSELRYVGQPLPALSALAPDSAVLLGTFSSVLSPALSCGYLVVPGRLVERVTTMRTIFGQPVSAITQAALAHYLASGDARRHTGSIRRAYKRRRNVVTQRLSDVPGLELIPIVGGLHAVIRCSDDIIDRARDLGVDLTPLRDYWGGAQAAEGAVIGFGHLDDETLARALDVIVEAAGA